MKRSVCLSVLLGLLAVGGVAFGQGAATKTPSTADEWIDHLKQPCPYFKWGFDFRLRHEHMFNQFTLNDDAANREWGFERYRPRLSASILPAKDWEINSRIVWEGRHWWLPDSRQGFDKNEVIFDTLNVTARKPAGLPLNVTLGRQDIMMNEGWLFFEGTPLDGSRTVYMDAARVTLDLPGKNTLDVIYVNQFADTFHWLPPLTNSDVLLTEQDERGGTLYLTNKAIEKTELNAYFMYKHNERVAANGDDGDMYTIGGRGERQFTDNLKARVEAAYQFGGRNGSRLSAWGVNSRGTYMFNDAWKNQVHLSYEYLSGDDPDTGTNEAFVPLWARWPQWSELLVYTWATETRIAEITNIHRIALGWQGTPYKDLDLMANYHLLFGAENYPGRAGFSNGGDFRGQLFTAILRYRFNRFLSGHLMGEYFLPGNFYSKDRRDPATYLRAEIVFAL